MLVSECGRTAEYGVGGITPISHREKDEIAAKEVSWINPKLTEGAQGAHPVSQAELIVRMPKLPALVRHAGALATSGS